jgi:16S rRNA (cytosine967-C5)-methyltransferase
MWMHSFAVMTSRQASGLTDSRLAALQVLLDVLDKGRSLDAALPGRETVLPESRDRAFCRTLAYGVLREHRRLEALRDRLLAKPLRRRDQDLALVLELGLFQLSYLDTPPHAAVSETVALTRTCHKAWAGKLVNAVLRRFLREKTALTARVDRTPAVAASLPDWLYQRLATKAYQARLAAAGLEADPLPGFADALVLARPTPVADLPGFAQGDCSVQDGAAQLAADLIDAAAGERVLDACAAPGGKAAHILERADVELLALDSDPSRVERLDATLGRIGLGARSIPADAAEPANWWDGQAFDRILLDAPCSGSGVIRRHPDIKWLRRAEDIARLTALQGRLLQALWPLLRPGGRLVYATCSVLEAENEAQAAAFVQGRADLRVVEPTLPVGTRLRYGQQIRTGESGVDGFYYACFEKH